MKLAVITVSDRAAKGLYEDRSGPAIVAILKAKVPGALTESEIVPDGIDSLLDAFARHNDADWIITTGGTGPSPRDQTPEATTHYCDRMLPGIAEYLRNSSLSQTPYAVFSRGVAGMRGTQFIVNFPGSVEAAKFCTDLLLQFLDHGIAMAQGKGH
ncbi:MAG: MogA/MoaB family molybdenum cofactor biosynthesis protein [Spirochaetaceae bacterium]|nr:MogA/MoaB family molybdenum cofactor biosynthesis protein [Spirochaetaceae bacterium]